jgi:NADH-quinone oxidoreductase subunit J
MIQNIAAFFTNGQALLFFILAIAAITGVVMMNSVNKVVHMVVSMALTFISLAGIYILLQAEFVAMVQVLVYGGAITILMVFGIMMTKHDNVEVEESVTPHKIAATVGVLGLFGILFIAIQKVKFSNLSTFTPGANNTRDIGLQLFHKHVISFELVSVLLTVAFIGAIVLAKKEEE